MYIYSEEEPGTCTASHVIDMKFDTTQRNACTMYMYTYSR